MQKSVDIYVKIEFAVIYRSFTTVNMTSFRAVQILKCFRNNAVPLRFTAPECGILRLVLRCSRKQRMSLFSCGDGRINKDIWKQPTFEIMGKAVAQLLSTATGSKPQYRRNCFLLPILRMYVALSHSRKRLPSSPVMSSLELGIRNNACFKA